MWRRDGFPHRAETLSCVARKRFGLCAILFVMGMIARRTIKEIGNDEASYLGDNLPLNLANRIKHG